MTTIRSGREQGLPRSSERARLQASVARARDELSRSLGELREGVRAELQWREWVRRRPLLAVVVVAALGYRLGRGRAW